MTRDRESAEPSPLVLEAVLKAAEVARIGVAVSILQPGSSRCIYATETAAQLLGTSRASLLGASLRDFIIPEHVGRVAELGQAMMEDPRSTGGTLEVLARRPDGTQAGLELAYSPVMVEGQPAVVTFLINVGEQRATAQRVRETAQRLAQMIEQTPDAVVISRRGVILEANPAAANMLGVKGPAELTGLSLAQFLQPEEAAVMGARMASVARGEDPGPPHAYRALRADGTEVVVEMASFASEHGSQPARAFLSQCPNSRLQKPFSTPDLEAALQQVLTRG